MVVQGLGEENNVRPISEMYTEWFRYSSGYNPGVQYNYLFKPLEWSQNDEIALIAKMGVKYHQHELNAGNFLVEGHRVWALLKAVILNLSVAIKALVNHDVHRLFVEWDKSGRNKPDQALKTAATGWLALQYGVIPLIGDVKNMGEALAALELNSEKPPYELHVSRSIMREVKNVPYIGRFTGYNLLSNATYDDVVMTISIREKVTKRYIVQLGQQPDYYLFQSLGLASPIQALWEVSPYSFLVDWVIAIQKTLEAEQALNEIPMLAVLTSTKKKTWYDGVAFTASANVKFVDFQTNDAVEEEFSRQRVYDLVVPRPTLRPLKNMLSDKHLSILFALLIQLLKSKHLYYNEKDLKALKSFVIPKGKVKVYEPGFIGPAFEKKRVRKQPLNALTRSELE
jgi:hypothetical protein